MKLTSSPYKEPFHRRLIKSDTELTQTLKDKTLKQKKTESKVLIQSKPKKISFCINYRDRFETSEAAKHLKSKLAYLLSIKSPELTVFTIYTRIYHELANYLDDFKELLEILRKGLAVSAIHERNNSNFEFKDEIDISCNEFSMLLEKERIEKIGLINKLNALSYENDNLNKKLENMSNKYDEYDKIIHSNPSKFIAAQKLLEKMLKQCDIIKKQQNYIQVLKYSELKLNVIISECQQRGINIEKIIDEAQNTVLNPSISKILKKSQTFDWQNSSSDSF